MFTLCALLLTANPATPAEWSQWMGPNRDGVWHEVGIRTTFPAGGPKKLWNKPIEGGYSGPAVAGGRVYVMDYVRTAGDPAPDPGKANELQGEERVLCFDAKTGDLVWTHKYNCPYHVSYPVGPRCTTTIHEGKVYALGTMGHFHVLDAATGNVVYKKHFETDYSAKTPIWGFAGHPLIYKDTVILNVGGANGLLVALDKNKDPGKEVRWQSVTTPAADGQGYCPPSLIEAGGVTQLVVWTPTAIVSVNPDTGKEYWKEPLKPSYGMSIMMPRMADGLLYAGGIGNAAVALRLDKQKPAAVTAWTGTRNTAVYPANSTPLIDHGTIYGADVSGHLRAVDLATGNRLWERTEPTQDAAESPAPHGTAFLVRNAANGHYYIFNEKGSLVVAKLTPKDYTETARAKLIDPTTPAFNRTVVWSHPAYAGGCIFVRNDKELACFDLKE